MAFSWDEERRKLIFQYLLCAGHAIRKWKKVKSLSRVQLFATPWPTLWDPMDYTVHGILQARVLEWVAFPFSRGSFQPRDQAQVSCIAGRFKLSHKGSPPKAKLAPKKKGQCHCLVVCCLSVSLQFSVSQGNHYIWEVCSANWWDDSCSHYWSTERSQFFSRTIPNHTLHNHRFKTWTD